MELKKRIRKAINSQIPGRFVIREKQPDFDTMKKAAFVSILKDLREIEDRRDFMETELGIDITQYEDKFFRVIENLFRITFNKAQLGMIQTYLYQLLPDKEWDGKVTLQVGKNEEQVFDSKTPDQLWNIICMLDDKQ